MYVGFNKVLVIIAVTDATSKEKTGFKPMTSVIAVLDSSNKQKKDYFMLNSNFDQFSVGRLQSSRI